MQPHITWIITAKSSYAKIYAFEKKSGPLHLVHVFQHPESKLHERDLSVDRPGRSSERSGPSRYAFESHMPLHEQEAHNFAAFLANHLEKEREARSFHKLCISAAPYFLGLLRQKIMPQTVQIVAKEMNLDMTQMDPDEILSHFLQDE